MSKVTQTILDPSKEVARTSFSSEHEGALYFDKDDNRIPYIEQEVEYKPEYDFETKDITHWWFRTESVVYRDVHTEVAKFRSRNAFTKYLKAIIVIKFDKHVWRAV